MTRIRHILNSEHGFGAAFVFALVAICLIIGAGIYVGMVRSENSVDKVQSAPKTITWKSYTMPLEGLKFKYPSNWNVSYDDSLNHDFYNIVAIDNPGKGKDAFGIEIVVGAGGFNEGFNVIGAHPIQYAGKPAYLVFGNNTKDSTKINRALVSWEATRATLLVSEKDTTENIFVMAQYTDSPTELVDSNKTQLNMQALDNDKNYTIAQRIIESMHY